MHATRAPNHLACGCPRVAVSERVFGEVRLRRSVHLPSCAIGAHRHGEARIVLPLDRGFETSHAGHGAYLAPGAAFFRPAQDTHVDRYAAPTTSVALLLSAADSARTGGRPFVVRDDTVAGIARGMAAEFDARDDAGDLVLEGLSLLLVSLALHARPVAERGCPKWIATVRERLEDDPATAPTLVQLGREVDRDPTHVAATFTRVYGRSIGTYLRQLRLARACAYLQAHPRCRLADVGPRFGFSDQSHFNRHFRRWFRLTPGEYLRRLR